MNTKFLFIRDNMTEIPVMAMKPDGVTGTSVLHRAGFGKEDNQQTYVFLTDLQAPRTEIDRFNWRNNSTLFLAHEILEAHWDEISEPDLDVRQWPEYEAMKKRHTQE